MFSWSCENSAVNEGSGDSLSVPGDNAVTAENVLIYIPSPIETAELLKQAGADYDMGLPNKKELVSRYTSTAAAALNLGVYGADLAFAGIFNQTNETMKYMECTRKLADALHVTAAFSDDRKTRLENNINNRDSVLSLITDAYSDCDGLLRDNNQGEASTFMIAGGWIEGLYLACKIAEKTNNTEIRVRIAEQRYSLSKLIAMMEKLTSVEGQQLLAELRELRQIFDLIPAQAPTPTTITQDSSTGITVLGEEAPSPNSGLNSLEFNRITEKITLIRNGIISKN